MLDDLVMGVDLGTGGARVAIAAADGELLALTSRDFPSGAYDQPSAWWDAASGAIGDAVVIVGSERARRLRAVAVDGTSGSVVGVDREGRPTTPALMYDDLRARDEAAELDAVAKASGYRTRVLPSFAIARIRWIERNRGEAFAAAERFVHQADFIAGRLTGESAVTDYSNALKTGFDLEADRWAGWIDHFPALRGKLPRVVAPGDPIGEVAPSIASSLGLPPGLHVVAGATDGTAAFLASGASRVGDDNTTLGTTLVFKRVADRPVHDATGRLYCHRLPGGCWLPGAASNVGAGWVRDDFAGADLGVLDHAASALLPTPRLSYPLRGRGERFPFEAPQATALCEPDGGTTAERFAANLQGTAFVERLGYEALDRAIVGADAARRGDVYTTGGGSHSDVWTQLRADATGRVYHRPRCPESAFGSAVLAASTIHGDVWTASRAMVRIERTFRPDPVRHRDLSEYYLRFRRLLQQRGLLAG